MSNFIYLSKSDLKVAQTCPTKLYYRKQGYPTNNTYNNYTKMLVDGGFIVHQMARLLYPDGIAIAADPDLDRDPENAIAQCIAQTKQELKKENVILFEPAIYAGNKLTRIDILIKQGDRFELIEVRSKAFDSEENAEMINSRGINIFRNKRDGRVSSAWRSCIADVSYQTYVLEEMLGKEMGLNVVVHPYLLLPDKSKTTAIEGLAFEFQIREVKSHNSFSKFNNVEVDFSGNLAQLQENHILALVSIKDEVLEVMPSVIESTEIFVENLVNGGQKIEVPISKNCKNCEFKSDEIVAKDGFRECWGELADVEPHILDLYHMGRIGGHENSVVNELIQQGKVSMYDIPMEYFDDLTYSFRQLVQLEHTNKNTEWISEHLPSILSKFQYPLHFIDFETSRMTVPYHAGMRPYEQVAFQWSCHTINQLGDPPIHSDWIATSNKFPNFSFARALMEQIGDRGTILTWAPHENNVLRDIYAQMEVYDRRDPELKTWLLNTAKIARNSKSRLVDMNAMTLQHYFHPLMKGRTSLKNVLPAIWVTNPYLHELPWLSGYLKEVDGKILNPYAVLPEMEILGKPVVINEGTGAMLAYQEILHGQDRDRREVIAKWQELLRQYCCLDTMAMVIVWTHWCHLTAD
jgi:CRISPR/Cas system-associated exonuclease Cas4 (RecB family)